MMIVRKSPNMMSTMGRMPAMAAPTPSPLNPASEIGVSMMRSLPNSSTRPVSTLNVVPASATSSPMRMTLGSRRISSAIASLMASPKLSSRTLVAVSSIDVLRDLARVGVRRVDRELDGRVHLGDELRLNRIERGTVRDAVGHQPLSVQRDRIALGDPLLLFGLRPVVGPRDVAHVVAVVAVRDALQKRRPLAASRAVDERRGGRVHIAHVLPVDRLVRDAERRGTRRHVARRRLREVRVFVVAVVLADENHGQLPELREVHLLVQEALAERALAEEADR